MAQDLHAVQNIKQTCGKLIYVQSFKSQDFGRVLFIPKHVLIKFKSQNNSHKIWAVCDGSRKGQHKS